jgi:hypothetical protein
MKSGFLSDSYIRRLIGPVPKTAPGYNQTLRVLKSEALDDQSKAARTLAITWCELQAVQRQHIRHKGGLNPRARV